MSPDLSYLPPEVFAGLPRRPKFNNRPSRPYFWLPCPLCFAMSSGKDWEDRDGHASSVPSSPGSGHAVGICPDCTLEGRGCLARGYECGGVAHPDFTPHWIVQETP